MFVKIFFMKFISQVLVVLIFSSQLHAQVVVTAAGTAGVGGYSGDGGPATNARMAIPFALAFDRSGNFYFSDDANARVRKVTSSGTISLFAGTGSPGYGGDGGLAIHARIGFISGIATDTGGNVYLADGSNSCVRRISPDGIITTIAGTGTAGYNGDGILATAAQLNSPQSVAVDDTGNVYICDRNNYRIRKVRITGTIETIVGTGLSGFSADGALADTASIGESYCINVDHYGNVLFKDGNRIRKINYPTRIIGTIAGNGFSGYSGDGGAANLASIATVQFTTDSVGNFFLSEQAENRLRKVSAGGQISTISGTGSVGIDGEGVSITTAKIPSPTGIAFSTSGELFFADATARIRKITQSWDGLSDVVKSLVDIDVFPNPTTSSIYFKVQSYEEYARVSIADITGVVVRSFSIKCNTLHNIDAYFLSGIYFLSVNVGGRIFVKEIIVNR